MPVTCPIALNTRTQTHKWTNYAVIGWKINLLQNVGNRKSEAGPLLQSEGPLLQVPESEY